MQWILRPLAHPSCRVHLFTIDSTCNANFSKSVVESMRVGNSSCTVTANNGVFGDPCSGLVKYLAVKVSCSTASLRPVFSCKVTIPVGSSAAVVLSAFGGGTRSELYEDGVAVWTNGNFVAGVAGVTGGSSDGKSISLTVVYVFTVVAPT